MIWITTSFIEILMDTILAVPLLDLYYFAGENKVSPEAVAIKLIMAPLFAITFLNFMPSNFTRFVSYWLLRASFSTFFEWTTIYFGYLTYNGWKLWDSAVFYVIISCDEMALLLH
ncbi:hypothetical protein ABLT31_14640 [Ammoniphilus sp. 3BR4]